MVKWTENINGEPYTSRGVRTVRGRVFGDPAVVIQKGAGRLAYIVTTTLKPDGQTILMHNIRVEASPRARREIEIAYGLRRVDTELLHEQLKVPDGYTKRVLYGQNEITKNITGVLAHVLDKYHFTTLDELNGLLYLYRIRAYPGKPGSFLRVHQGLLYQALKANGKPIGAPLKSSSLGKSYTLRSLQNKFLKSIPVKLKYRKRMNYLLRFAVQGDVQNMEDLKLKLQKENVSLVLLQGKMGKPSPENIVLVDHTSHTVFGAGEFTGSLLTTGNSYQAGKETTNTWSHSVEGTAEFSAGGEMGNGSTPLLYDLQHFLTLLLQQDTASEGMDPALKQRKQKKKKWSLANHH